jgi:signal transduction histidine kinase
MNHSHNLRGPVSTILGLIQIYNFKKIDDPANVDVITYAKKAVLTLDRVIKDLNYIISLKKATPEEYSEVSFEDVYHTVCSLLQEEISASGVIIHKDFQDISMLHSVPAYWQNIFYNLISNSIKYSRPDIPPVIVIKTTSTGKEVSVKFSDNGTGMNFSQIQKEKIFKLFQRATTSQEGRGVGLYLVKTHVELLGGTIDVESQLGYGTTFYITVPLTKKQQLS